MWRMVTSSGVKWLHTGATLRLKDLIRVHSINLKIATYITGFFGFFQQLATHFSACRVKFFKNSSQSSAHAPMQAKIVQKHLRINTCLLTVTQYHTSNMSHRDNEKTGTSFLIVVPYGSCYRTWSEMSKHPAFVLSKRDIWSCGCW